jgi:hypothetical protein
MAPLTREQGEVYIVVIERINDDQYLALCLYQLTEAERGGCWGGCVQIFIPFLQCVLHCVLCCTRGGSFSQKIESANPTQLKISGLTPGISSCSVELAACVHRPIMDSESTIAG